MIHYTLRQYVRKGKSPYTTKYTTCQKDFLSKQHQGTTHLKVPVGFHFFPLYVGSRSSVAKQNEG